MTLPQLLKNTAVAVLILGMFVHPTNFVVHCYHFKVTGSLHADTRAVYLIKRYFIVFLSPKTKPCDPTWTWKTVLK